MEPPTLPDGGLTAEFSCFRQCLQAISVQNRDFLSLDLDETGVVHFKENTRKCFRDRPQEAGQLPLGDIEGQRVPLSFFVAEGEQVGGQSSGNFLEGQVLDLNRKLPQAQGKIGQQIHAKGGVAGEQRHKVRPGEEK